MHHPNKFCFLDYFMPVLEKHCFNLLTLLVLGHEGHRGSKDSSPGLCCYGASGSPRVGLAVNISGLLYMVCCRYLPPHFFFFFSWNSLQMHLEKCSAPNPIFYILLNSDYSYGANIEFSSNLIVDYSCVSA